MNRKQRRADKSRTGSENNHAPPAVQALFNQALQHHQAERWGEAQQLYRQILMIDPRHAGSLHLTGLLAFQVGSFEIAVELIGRAIAITNNEPVYHNHLGCAFKQQARLDEAMASFNRALVLNPEFVDALNNMAGTLKAQGRSEEAIVYYKKALAIKKDALQYSNLLLAMIYAASVSPDELTAMAREFGDNVADPLLRRRNFSNIPDPARKLRIGYVSPDFKEHAVSYFTEPLIGLHDRENYESFAYSNATQEDQVTSRFKHKFAHWRPIRFLKDDQVADLIEADKIDILIDLAGHTDGNRLEVLARKPAPVQISWLGFPATTGMKAMDYRITDCCAEPEGMTEHLNVETLWRLPQIFCCYKAHENSPAVIDHPPFEDNGHITFGCFNNFTKVTDTVLAAWAKIMARVPEARLLLEISGLDSKKFKAEVEERLRRCDLPLERVKLETRRRENQFVLYNRIDIALDPFPCNGGTTSFDTMWMGVPFVTLSGDHFVSRMGVTILTNAGLPELIAKNTDEYIKIATDLALDRNRLRRLRHGLRDRVEKSPLMDQVSFARNMEAAYREMWRKWCAR